MLHTRLNVSTPQSNTTSKNFVWFLNWVNEYRMT